MTAQYQSEQQREPTRLSVNGASTAPMQDPSASESLHALWLREGLQRCRRGAQNYAVLVITLTCFSAAYSWFFETGTFRTLAPIRLAQAAATVAMIVALRTRLGERYPRQFGLLLMLIAAVAVSALALETGGQTSPQQQRLVLVLYGSAVMLTWSGWWAVTGCSLVLTTFAIFAAATGQLGSEHLAGNIGRLVFACLVCVAINITRERYRWRELWNVYAAAQDRRRADSAIRALNEKLEQRVVERTAELHASERRVRAMFESAPIGVITVEASGRIIEANAAFATMLGDAAGTTVGSSIFDLTAPADRARTRAAYQSLTTATHDTFAMDKHYLHPNGEEVAAHEVVSIVRDDTGAIDYALAMIEDVSDRLRAEGRAREHEGRLAHVLRIATLNEAATELAHEINQPLGAIVNFANGTVTRLRNSNADPEIIESVSRISSEALRAAAILKRMHGFVQSRETVREDTDVNTLVNDVALLIAGDARRCRVTLELRCAPSLPVIAVDPAQIEQLIFNLAHNAIDATRNRPDESTDLVIETSVEQGCVTVRVRDSGPGIDLADRERMFDAFYTTKPGGLGMGLSISRTIVEAHGGRLWAEDNPGPGTTMGFAIPLDDEHAVQL